MGDKAYTPPEISAMILQKLKADAEERTGEEITQAVITVPAYFDDSQRQATKNAGEIAGLEVLRIINEPTAAAFAYGFDKKQDQQIAVYDLGGGTFDVSVLDISHDTEDNQSTVEVKATSGDTHLGGDDFDKEIIEWILEEFKKQEGMDLGADPLSLQRVKDAAEKAKIELSSTPETEINEPFITSTSEGPKHLNMKLSRAKLEELGWRPCRKDHGAGQKSACRLRIQKRRYRRSDSGWWNDAHAAHSKESGRVFWQKSQMSRVNPDEVVAMGAAVQAGQLQGDLGKDIFCST